MKQHSNNKNVCNADWVKNTKPKKFKQSTLAMDGKLKDEDCRHLGMYSKLDPEDDELIIVYCCDCDYEVRVRNPKPIDEK